MTEMVQVPKAAFDWLMGLGDDFEPQPGQRGAFWWRSEFRRRIAALVSMGGCGNRSDEPQSPSREEVARVIVDEWDRPASEIADAILALFQGRAG